MFIFLVRERTRNMLKDIKSMFLHKEFTAKTENFIVLKIKGCTPVVVGCCYDLLPFVANFQLGIS